MDKLFILNKYKVDKSEIKLSNTPITRRTLLKAIIAGSSGIVASAFLPEKWVKPVVSSGVLPVHAQASGNGAGLGSIQGTVINGGNPVSGVTVSASTADVGSINSVYKLARPKGIVAPIYTGSTNNSGHYIISNLPPGEYFVWADEPFGYHKGAVTVNAGLPTTVNFLILPID